MTRREIVLEARSYNGTPFQHMGRQPGIALDCAGVLICVGRALKIFPPDFDVPAYSINPSGRQMIEVCDRYLIRVPKELMEPGDVAAMIVDADPQHLGIVGDYWHGGLSIIHAASKSRPPRVLETRAHVQSQPEILRSL